MARTVPADPVGRVSFGHARPSGPDLSIRRRVCCVLFWRGLTRLPLLCHAPMPVCVRGLVPVDCRLLMPADDRRCSLECSLGPGPRRVHGKTDSTSSGGPAVQAIAPDHQRHQPSEARTSRAPMPLTSTRGSPRAPPGPWRRASPAAASASWCRSWRRPRPAVRDDPGGGVHQRRCAVPVVTHVQRDSTVVGEPAAADTVHGHQASAGNDPLRSGIAEEASQATWRPVAESLASP